MNQSFDLPSVLTELIYGDEATESLEQTIGRTLARYFVLRLNGQMYDRSKFTTHILQMRQMTSGGGEIRVLEQISTATAVAGRYLFRMVSAERRSLTVEAHLFARVNEGKVERIIEVARQVENDAEEDFLADT
jgi:hypothetical protein